MTAERDPRIIVIGAGVAGIATAVTLQRAGFRRLTILEKGSAVGGVWHWNRYPGLTCDVPSQLYQFSFAPKTDWSRTFATGAEIQHYLADTAHRFELDRYLRLNAEAVGAEYGADGWRVQLADGDVLHADFLISATGILHHPSTPDIPGLDSFAGDVVHTARWPDGLATAGRRIAVIGTGSTGVQVVSALQPDAAAVTHFVRTPQWVLWAPMRLPQLPGVDAVLRLPGVHRRTYDALLWGSGFLADIVTKPSWRRRLAQECARFSLRAQVRDPNLRDRLTPIDEPLCKRQVMSDSYYKAIASPGSELVTTEIAEITPLGVRTTDDRLYEADLLVLATGFRTHDYMRPMQLLGRDGMSIDEAWAKGPRAYRTTAIPGFPNFFTVLGPNSPTASISLQYTAELTARYLVQWLRRWQAEEFDRIEVTEEATQRFNDEVAAALGPTVWNTGCNSWYLTESGGIDLFPFDRARLTELLREPDPRDFHLERTRSAG
ncbi:flavin-containing monooxygenase [Skermania piniformis]|uniref:NAD(P)/FAD-dependent oxidoreductase n=1 Tax=Skermania pinensis TaxID=39122 RepID=A0ABX8SC67_9ACTN|nr:NAD(P)/FAD-dependent oxidoreductase [Skermania piniformis]QXQ15475.1 NAD(P)/FAD-dependent oxidoreductase [Skermania piniformis]